MVLHRLRRSLGDEFKLRSRNKTERGWWKYVDKKRKREANKISPFLISASIFSCSSHVTCHIYKVHRTDSYAITSFPISSVISLTNHRLPWECSRRSPHNTRQPHFILGLPVNGMGLPILFKNLHKILNTTTACDSRITWILWTSHSTRLCRPRSQDRQLPGTHWQHEIAVVCWW